MRIVARYECKYYLTQKQYEMVMRWIGPYIQPDPYAAGRPGNIYTISSLYLDSSDFRIGQMTVDGNRNRFKLRIRSYDDNPQSPIFFEIKRRIDGVIEKMRLRMRREDGKDLLEGRIQPAQVARGQSLHDLEAFMGLMAGCDAGPMIRVRYEREAYEALPGEPVRLTFDRDLAYALTPDANFSVGGPGWRAVAAKGIIFEVKFPHFYPFWVGEMIHEMQLLRVPIAKYVICYASSVWDDLRMLKQVPIAKHIIALNASREKRFNSLLPEGFI